MSHRRRYEGDEDLELRLLEVTEEPILGEQAQQNRNALALRVLKDLEDTRDEAEASAARTLH